MKVLVINCGSSSLKYQLMNPETREVFAKGLCERIGIDGSRMEYEVPAKDYEVKIEKPMPTHKEALELVINAITDKEHGVIASVDEVEAIGHRMVHGGETFASSVLLTEEAMAAVEANNELAPLHNPANLMGVRTCMALMPGKPNVGVFDTAFHQTMPAKAFMYALPYEDYSELKVRKYGFHGTSHLYVSETMREIMGNPEHSKIIVCHLGNGASVSAVLDGKSIDTSMGFTPLAGIMMGTRAGSIDPSVISFLIEEKGYTIEQIDEMLNKKSGVLGVSGVSSDFRDVRAAAQEGNERAQLALDIFHYKIKTQIAAYAGAMGGIDVIVFTAGIGENAALVRSESLKGLEFLGFNLDAKKNEIAGEIGEISTDDSRVKVYVIPTNEELMIARDTARLAQ